MLNKQQAQFLLDLVYKNPVQTTLGDIMKGLKLDANLEGIVNELRAIISNEVNQIITAPAAKDRRKSKSNPDPSDIPTEARP